MNIDRRRLVLMRLCHFDRYYAHAIRNFPLCSYADDLRAYFISKATLQYSLFANYAIFLDFFTKKYIIILNL